MFLSKYNEYLKTKWLALLLLLVIVISGAYLRCQGLDKYYYNSDEANQISFGSYATFLGLFDKEVRKNSHPFLGKLTIHVLKRISDDRMFLITFKSIIPAILTIIVFYAIGARFCGAAAGLFMAFIANYSYEMFQLSQLLRGYSLFIFFLSLGTYYLMRYLNEGKWQQHVLLYVFLAIASMLHFSAIFPISAVAAIILLEMLIKRKNWEKILVWGIFWPGLILAIYLYSIYQEAADTSVFLYSPNPVPANFLIWLKTLIDLIKILTFPFSWFASFFLVLIIYGGYILYRKGKWHIPSIIILMLALNTATAMLGKYPFTAYRVCLFYLPFFLILIGYAVQEIFENITRYKESAYKELLLVVTLGFISFNYFGFRYVEAAGAFRPNNILYFMVTRENYNDVINNMSKKVEKSDVVIADGVTANYFIAELDMSYVEKRAPNLYRIMFKDKPIYFNYDEQWPRFDSEDELKQFLVNLDKVIDKNTKRLWYVRLGWDNPLSFYRGLGDRGNINRFQRYAENGFVAKNNNYPSGELYSVNWEKIKEAYGIGEKKAQNKLQSKPKKKETKSLEPKKNKKAVKKTKKKR